MTDSCYDSPTLHAWAGADDIDHAATTGQETPAGWCGCAFCGEPAVRREVGSQAKASRLVEDSSRVLLANGGGGERGRGTVVGYYDHPTYIVQLDNGERVAWSERLVHGLDDRGVTE